MNKNKILKISILIFIVIAIIFIGFNWYSSKNISIKKITLSSPNNYAFQKEVTIELNKPASVFVKYWKKGSDEIFQTTKSEKKKNHNIQLLLLECNTDYQYQVIIEGLINATSKTISFHTRDQSPWLKHGWVSEENAKNAISMGDGLVLLCNARLPGYIAMVDGKGQIRWYFQLDDIGIRAATFTPRGTILAMLKPPTKDVRDDAPKSIEDIQKEDHAPLRRGAMGFAGGTGFAEIDLSGKLLWRVDFDKMKDSKYKIIHHDVRMDNKGQIHTLVRESILFDKSQIGKTGIDTLTGDGIIVTDTKGNIIREWSVWDIWDPKKDPDREEFAYDRFHMNSLNFDKDSNYLLSVAVEDQIWKVNSKTGKLMWKFGKNGDFKMDTASNFSFQHSLHLNPNGDLMLFDNSLFRKESRVLSFTLDTIEKTAKTQICLPLPKSKYTSRMGSAYVMPNGNLLVASSKTGSVMIMDQKGKILWELHSYFVPYRAEYVPFDFWKAYFSKEE